MPKRGALWPLFRMPPATLHTDTWVTVTHPPCCGTVVSVQADGGVRLAPPGTQGPCETGLLKPDRIVYAPHGAAGAVYLLPFAGEALPNT
jgi:hypothetical protein